MAQGAAQMKCCSAGCTGSGAAAKTKQSDITEGAGKASQQIIPKRSLDFRKLRFPDEACNGRIFRLEAFSRAFPLSVLLLPAKAEALAGSSCLDAMLALTTGGLMLINGIMGMRAADQSGQMASQMLGNMGGMGSLGDVGLGTGGNLDGLGGGGSGSTSGSSQERSPASVGNGAVLSDTVRLDPALLRTGTANDIMTRFESQFGIGRDAFAKAVMGGEDPRRILSSAPQNPLNAEDINKATEGAKAMSPEERAAAMAGTEMSKVNKELTAMAAGAEEPSFAVSPGAGSRVAASTSRKTGLEDLDFEEPAQEERSLSLSPGVQAALAAREGEDRRNGYTELSLFQLVHSKYREKSAMIFGFGSGAAPKGGGKSHGF